jgi:hypothetical protein
MTAAPNRFFVWPANAPAAVEFSPQQKACEPAAGDLRYFYELALELDRKLGDRGVTFALTWHIDAFDDRWRGGVVILIGDEKYQTPAYAGAVRAVFKTGGTRRNPISDTLRLAPSIAWRELLRELRNAIEARRRHGLRGPERMAMFEVPLGYFGLVDCPPVPFAERPTDVFFAGSVEPGRSFTVRPRLAARRQMLAALAIAQRRCPGLRVDCTRSGPFANPQDMLSASTYTARLMQAKIALCPRGNFDETFRLVEAAKAGCVAIVERLPKRWYNRDSPAVQLDRWSSLPEVLEELLADGQGLARRSDQMRAWWTENLSERAGADFIAGVLDHGG